MFNGDGTSLNARKFDATRIEAKTRRKTFSHLRTAATETQKNDVSHCIVIDDEKWIYYVNTKRRKVRGLFGQSLPSSTISLPKWNIHCSTVSVCVWRDKKGMDVKNKVKLSLEIVTGCN